MHTLTAVEVAKMILGVKINVDGVEGKQGRITVEGSSILNPHFPDQV